MLNATIIMLKLLRIAAVVFLTSCDRKESKIIDLWVNGLEKLGVKRC